MLRAKKTRTAHITATTAIGNLFLLPSLELFKNFPPLVGSVSSACSVGFVGSTDSIVMTSLVESLLGSVAALCALEVVVVEVVVSFVVATIDVVTDLVFVSVVVGWLMPDTENKQKENIYNSHEIHSSPLQVVLLRSYHELSHEQINT